MSMSEYLETGIPFLNTISTVRSERLARVEQITDGIGWGFHDHIGDVVWQLEEELGDQ
jgi:hypothetical protein